MKKRFILILSAVLCLAVPACGGKPSPLADILAPEAEEFPDYTGKELSELERAWGEPLQEETRSDGSSFSLWEWEGRYVGANARSGKVTECYPSAHMQVQILEVSGDVLLVKPLSPDWVAGSNEQIFMSLSWFAPEDQSRIAPGALIDVEFDGLIMESAPAQMHQPFAYRISGEGRQ